MLIVVHISHAAGPFVHRLPCMYNSSWPMRLLCVYGWLYAACAVHFQAHSAQVAGTMLNGAMHCMQSLRWWYVLCSHSSTFCRQPVLLEP